MDSDIHIEALTPPHWPQLEALFGRNGACGGCWCMLWRAPYGGARFEADKGEPNRSKLRALVESGRAKGSLAFRGGRPIGWVSYGPRDDFPYFERSRVLAAFDGTARWVVSCFYLPAAERGHGVATALLAGAVEAARAAGAPGIEGYPVEPKGKRVAAAFAWTGVPALFERAGFIALRHPTSQRLICRLDFAER